ncbi:MAG: right-handed parallel beta-helix repeat-containing protein [Bacteroidales bacterium]|nr:right-handed parallel beta-helix repeat-containing protein [Bacteroidales bacterium]
MKRYFLICILLAAWIPSNATVRYVSMLGNDNNNGLAWSTAKRNIDGAMNDAAQGDTVFVAIGTYPQFSAKNGVHVFGGFLGTEQNLAERQAMHHGYLQDSSCTRIFTADQSANFLTSYHTCIDHVEDATTPTVIDGMVVKVDNVYSYSAVLILALLDGTYSLSNCTLDGAYIVIDNGTYSKRASYGFSTTSNGRGFSVSDCTVKNCSQGCLLSTGSRTINCLFEHNGTPIETRQMNNDEYGHICIEDCLIQNNCRNISYSQFMDDKALLNLYNGVDLRRCVIRNNSLVATYHPNSAEIITAYRKCRITDCLIANNSVSATRTHSNLIYLRGGSNILQNNTIASNMVNDSLPYEPSSLLRADVNISLYNNLFWGNAGYSQFFYRLNHPSTDNVMFNAMQDTLLGQTGNFRLDQDSIGPLFAGPVTFAGARFDTDSMQQVLTADWHLSSGSSCVNAGHPYHVSLPCQSSTDLDGLNRVSGGHIDIGCYEFPEADAEQQIVWDQPMEAYRSAGYMMLTASTTSGLPVSYSSSNSNVAVISGDTLLLRGSGQCTISASQAGDSIWLPAPSVNRTLTVWGDTLMIHDTISVYDTITVYDTVPVFDTTWVMDSVLVFDTITIYDTTFVTIYDTVQVSIEEVDVQSADWTMNAEGEYISVRGAEGETIRIFDVHGRQLHIQQTASAAVRFRVPSAGVYLVKVGNAPARKLVVIKHRE